MVATAFGENPLREAIHGRFSACGDTIGIRFRTLLLCSLLLVGCGRTDRESRSPEAPKAPAPVELTAEVDRAEARVGEPIRFRITLEAEPGISASLPEVGSQIQGFRIVDMGQEGPKQREGRTWSQRWYELRADLTGSYTLPVARLAYTDAEGKERTAETAQLFVEVKSVLGQGTDEKDIRDLKPLEKAKREIPRSWFLFLLVGLLIAALGIGAFLYFCRKRRIHPLIRTPEEIARDELAYLEAAGLLEEERYREYVFGLSLIFRRYLERRFGVPAAEQTTEEIHASLRKAKHLDKTVKEMARSFLEETDPIKYRGLEPRPAETEVWRSRLMSFLDLAIGRENLEEAA
jgi:hypothetical protein